MAFTKGHKLATGRPKGSSNNNTSKVRESFKNLVEDNLDTIKSDLEALEPKDRLKTILELAKFVIPTLKAQELKVESDNLPSYLLSDEALNDLIGKKK